MYYFKKLDDKIEKYSVEFEKEKLERLRKEIIDNCSLVKHFDYETDYLPRNLNDKYHESRNYSYKNTGRVNEYFEESRSIYRVIYDEYKYPVLVVLIDMLLDGQERAIDSIFSSNGILGNATTDFQKEIEKLSNELDSIDNLDIEKKKDKLKELEATIKKASLLSNYGSVSKYYKKVQCLIRLKLIDSISIDKVESVISFFNDDIENYYERNRVFIKK